MNWLARVMERLVESDGCKEAARGHKGWELWLGAVAHATVRAVTQDACAHFPPSFPIPSSFFLFLLHFLLSLPSLPSCSFLPSFPLFSIPFFFYSPLSLLPSVFLSFSPSHSSTSYMLGVLRTTASWRAKSLLGYICLARALE